MGSDSPVCMLGLVHDLCNWKSRCATGQNYIFRHYFIQFLKNLLFNGYVLNGSFNNQIDILCFQPLLTHQFAGGGDTT